MNDHSSRRSEAPWPAEDQPTSRREARSQRSGRRSRPNLGLLAGPAALLVVGAGLAATGISRAADTPAPQDLVAPAAARGGQAQAAAPNQNNGGNKNGAKNTKAKAAATTTTTSGTVANPGNGAGTGTTALPGKKVPGTNIPAAPVRIRHRGDRAPACSLIVPQNPLSAEGLATPYQLVTTAECDETVKDQAVFVQGAIITPQGEILLYNPLVINKGTEPLATPPVPKFPAGSTVAIWFGANGDTMTLASSNGRGNSLAQGNCVNGLPGSIFGQYGYCNAPQFFSAARRAKLSIPDVGIADDGKRCPTVRDFMVVDQDQSDNVNTHYLAVGNRTAQPFAKPDGAIDLANGSDNRLTTDFILPAMGKGCQLFQAPDLSNNRVMTSSLPLQELQAAAHQAAPVALVPLNNPMTKVGDAISVRKTNLYRVGVDQPLIWGRFRGGNPPAVANAAPEAANPAPAAAADSVPADAAVNLTDAANTLTRDAGSATVQAAPAADVQNIDRQARFRDNGSPLAYCQGIFQDEHGLKRVFDNQAALDKPDSSANKADADTLFTFLAARAQNSFEQLGCGKLLHIENPVTVFPLEGQVTAANFNFKGVVLGDTIPPTTSTTTPVDPAAVVPAPADPLMKAQPPVVQAPADAPAPAAAPAADPAPPAAPAPAPAPVAPDNGNGAAPPAK